LNSFDDLSSPGKDYTEEYWNPVEHMVPAQINLTNIAYKVTAADAVKHQDAVAGYNALKKLAEQAAWAFVKEKQPSFDLTVINPDIIIGPMTKPIFR
jgi:nucleoside-diphosphate-sugar epimerase